jgi:hypothetical protein
MGAVASRHVGGFARLQGSILAFQVGAHSAGCILEVEKLRPAFDLDAGLGQPLDQ